MDAIRISDGSRVIFKSLTTTRHPEEVPIQRRFSSAPLSSDPNNHCVALYEVLDDPESSERAFIVEPLLLPCDHVPFATVGEVLDLIGQLFQVGAQLTQPVDLWQLMLILKGLAFMHKHGVAHRYEPHYLLTVVAIVLISIHTGTVANRIS
jgi:hypothetical protein